MDVIYPDFSKVFVYVDYSSLLNVLDITGFDESFLSWFHSYLLMRKYWVKIHGVKSTIRDVPSVVPQGEYIFPLLIVIFVNGVKSQLSKSKIFIFAVDMKFFYLILIIYLDK